MRTPKGCRWRTWRGRPVMVKEDGTICGGGVPKAWHGRRFQEEPWRHGKRGRVSEPPAALTPEAWRRWLQAAALQVKRRPVPILVTPRYGLHKPKMEKEVGYVLEGPGYRALFGVHKPAWSLTHLATGLKVAQYRTRNGALAAGAFLQARADWSFTEVPRGRAMTPYADLVREAGRRYGRIG